MEAGVEALVESGCYNSKYRFVDRWPNPVVAVPHALLVITVSPQVGACW